jgi:hypothetical protein
VALLGDGEGRWALKAGRECGAKAIAGFQDGAGDGKCVEEVDPDEKERWEKEEGPER